MSYIQVECECGGKAMIYIREDRIYKTGEELDHYACDLCGSRVEASIVVKTTKRK